MCGVIRSRGQSPCLLSLPFHVLTHGDARLPAESGSWLEPGGMGQLGGGRSQRKRAARGVREDRRAQERHLAFVWRGREGPAPVTLTVCSFGETRITWSLPLPLLRCRRHRPRAVDSPSPRHPQTRARSGHTSPRPAAPGEASHPHQSRAAFLTLKSGFARCQSSSC